MTQGKRGPVRKDKGTAVERVADKFGGFAPFARLLGIGESAVRQWNMDKKTNRRGRDGSIPDKYHRLVMQLAAKKKVRVKPADLVNV